MSTFESFLLYFKVKAWNAYEQMRVISRYYKKPSFAFLDLCLGLLYLGQNPYRISRKFLQNNHYKDIHVYGETPLTTLEIIAKECSIAKNDFVYELGAGRGKSCFWLSQFTGCKTIGIEWIPSFATKAKMLAKFFGKNRVQFISEDMLKTDFTRATVIYLYGTCLDEDFIEKLIKKFSRFPKLKIITISYALTDYAPGKFQVEKEFEVPFVWGRTTAYLQKVIPEAL